jgi:hypothetical protein
VAAEQITEWRPDLIAKYESEGGQNLPNYLFDGPYGKRSAGGVCQMLTRNWVSIAPTIDIDLEKFPVAGTATEFDQWRACWKLWVRDGYGPWTCCNAKLRRALEAGEVRSVSQQPVPPRPSRVVAAASVRPQRPAPPPDRIAAFNARLAASSDVYNAMPISFR